MVIYENKKNTSFKNDILKAIESENLKDCFCKNKQGECENFFIKEETVRLFASDGMSFGGFCSEKDMENLLKENIIKNIDEIVEFLIYSRPIKTIITKYDKNIGYVYNKENKNDTNTVRMVLIKEKRGITKFGFFVSEFIPC